jgi:4-aminobutyrate aminotransferase
MGNYTLQRLQEIAERHPIIGDVRGKGLMIGVEFVKDRETRAYAPQLRDAVVDYAFEHGLLLLGCSKSVIRVAPPLCITRQEIDEGLAIFEEAVSAVEKRQG